jgi:hypothetical protein
MASLFVFPGRLSILSRDTSSRAVYSLRSSTRFLRVPFRPFSTPPGPDYEAFYRYDGGRWLWDEEAQLRKRYRYFNVAELKDLATRTVGAQACVSITKLAEGGSNKVFRLVMDNNAVVIARIPYLTWNTGRKIASEVATMDFVS